MQIKIDLDNAGRAERTWAAECARACVRHGSPELQFAQLSPVAEKVMSRLIVVRYERDRFVQRPQEGNEEFRQTLEKLVGDRYERGYFSNLIAGAGLPDAQQSVLIDSDAEMISYAGGRGSILFLSAPARDFHSLQTGKRDDLLFSADLEVTLPCEALLDLLDSWNAVAKALDKQ
jgi:hypothetical protein